MTYTEGLSGLSNNLKLSSITPKIVSTKKDSKIGRVYAIILDENTPSVDIFNLYGGWDSLGTVFYLDYTRREDLSYPQVLQKIQSNYFEVARPSDFNNKFYPLIGELISIQDMPSPLTPLSDNVKIKYYTKVLNYWNNSHHNADTVISSNILGKTFTALSNIRPLQPFEGDYIIEGRNGNGIRFGLTSKTSNAWWNTGLSEGDPITIFSNGHNYVTSSLAPIVENLNEGSVLCLTSTQKANLNALKTNLNPLTNPIGTNNYQGSQAIFTADRVVFLSRKDDLFLTSNNNIEIFTKNIINLDADDRVTINSSRVILGLDSNNLPINPALLGNPTLSVIQSIIQYIGEFATDLTTVTSTAEGAPIVEINSASEKLYSKVSGLLSNLTNILSTKVFIAK